MAEIFLQWLIKDSDSNGSIFLLHIYQAPIKEMRDRFWADGRKCGKIKDVAFDQEQILRRLSWPCTDTKALDSILLDHRWEAELEEKLFRFATPFEESRITVSTLRESD